jgi:hypothetical protein
MIVAKSDQEGCIRALHVTEEEYELIYEAIDAAEYEAREEAGPVVNVLHGNPKADAYRVIAMLLLAARG